MGVRNLEQRTAGLPFDRATDAPLGRPGVAPLHGRQREKPLYIGVTRKLLSQAKKKRLGLIDLISGQGFDSFRVTCSPIHLTGVDALGVGVAIGSSYIFAHSRRSQILLTTRLN
jgi:hypothetical protein